MIELLDQAFPGASAESRAAAAAHFTVREIPAGTLLIEEGADDPTMLRLVEGEVSVCQGDVGLAKLGAGQMVGEMALFGLRRRIASVETLTDAKLLELDRAGYEALAESGNDIAWDIERAALYQLGDRLRHMDEEIARLSTGIPSPWIKPEPSMLDRIRSWFVRGRARAPATAPRPRRVDPVEILRSSPMFAEAGEEQLQTFAEHMTAKAFSRGHFLCTQGEPGNSVYVLGRGTVDVVVTVASQASPRIARLARLEPGAVFGVTALMEGRARMASCVAANEVSVLELGRDTWLELTEKSTTDASFLRRAFIRALIHGLADADNVLARLSAAKVAKEADQMDTLIGAAARLEHDSGEWTHEGEPIL